MKTFLEEYGLVVVAAVIIIIFVAAATPIGEFIRDGVVTAVEKLTDSLEKVEVPDPAISDTPIPTE